MNREKLAENYIEAWNQLSLSILLDILHPQASYYDAFWGETCSGSNLAKYFETEFQAEQKWYRRDDELIPTQNGFIFRYTAFKRDDPGGLKPCFVGAEVFTVSDGRILTISDYYCDPSAVELLEIAKLSEKQHGRANIAPLGLSARTSARIRKRLSELAGKTGIYLDPLLTVTQLADHADCSVMHLFHVLEEELETTFVRYVNECRVRHASNLLAGTAVNGLTVAEIATQSGFESTEKFDEEFRSVFGIAPQEYAKNFAHTRT